MTLLGLYRVLSFPGSVKLSTIEDLRQATDEATEGTSTTIDFGPSGISITEETGGDIAWKEFLKGAF